MGQFSENGIVETLHTSAKLKGIPTNELGDMADDDLATAIALSLQGAV